MLPLRINMMIPCCILFIACFFQVSFSRDINIEGTMVCGDKTKGFGATVLLKHSDGRIFRQRVFKNYDKAMGANTSPPNQLINYDDDKFTNDEQSFIVEIIPKNVDRTKCHKITAIISVKKVEERMSGINTVRALNLDAGICNFATGVCPELRNYEEGDGRPHPGPLRQPEVENNAVEEPNERNNLGAEATNQGADGRPMRPEPGTNDGIRNDPVEGQGRPIPGHNADPADPMAHVIRFVLRVNGNCGETGTKVRAALGGTFEIFDNIPKVLVTMCETKTKCWTQNTVVTRGDETRTVTKEGSETIHTHTTKLVPTHNDNRVVDVHLHARQGERINIIPMVVSAPECQGSRAYHLNMPLSNIPATVEGGNIHEMTLNCNFERHPSPCTIMRSPGK